MNLDCLLIKSKSIKKTFVGRSFGTEIPRLRSRAAMVSVPTVAIVNGRRDKESKDSAAAAAESAPICSSYGTSVGWRTVSCSKSHSGCAESPPSTLGLGVMKGVDGRRIPKKLHYMYTHWTLFLAFENGLWKTWTTMGYDVLQGLFPWPLMLFDHVHIVQN